MGFRFRKSKRVGPLRLTLTHRGVSGSVGGGGLSYKLFGPGKRKGARHTAPLTSNAMSTAAALVFAAIIAVVMLIGSLVGLFDRGGKDAASNAPGPIEALPTQPAAATAPPVVGENERAAFIIEPPSGGSGDSVNTPAKTPATPRRIVRTWADTSGKYKVEARLIEAWNGVAYLAVGEKTKAVPLVRLSPADRTYVADVFPVQVIEGKVVGVTDGDTVTVLDGSNTQIKVRLDGIDAPEKTQHYSTQSTNTLADRVLRKMVRIEWRKKDKYGRVLGHVFIDDEWVNRAQVADGWAWHFKEYNQSAILAQAELDAREMRNGIWADDEPEAPWDFRAKPQSARAPPRINRPAQRSYAQTTSPTYTPTPSYYSPPSYSSPSYSAPSQSYNGGSVHVRGYYRKDGTYVRPHTRRR